MLVHLDTTDAPHRKVFLSTTNAIAKSTQGCALVACSTITHPRIQKAPGISLKTFEFGSETRSTHANDNIPYLLGTAGWETPSPVVEWWFLEPPLSAVVWSEFAAVQVFPARSLALASPS